MAYLKEKALFFTTSPRTPSKMIPEIELLVNTFSGKSWNAKTQVEFTRALAKSDFFEGRRADNRTVIDVDTSTEEA